jgi:hypothetical protein
VAYVIPEWRERRAKEFAYKAVKRTYTYVSAGDTTGVRERVAQQ